MQMTGRNSVMFVFLALMVFAMSGCATKSFIFGEEKGFCQDCGFQYKGVCANPMDIYYNSDIVMNKPAKCAKKKTKRIGIRK